jgi:hypothetical protein
LAEKVAVAVGVVPEEPKVTLVAVLRRAVLDHVQQQHITDLTLSHTLSGMARHQNPSWNRALNMIAWRTRRLGAATSCEAQ